MPFILTKRVISSGKRYWFVILFVSDIDNCLLHQCKNGATCKDKVNGYECICQIGYTGQHCDTGICMVFVLP